MRKKLAMILKIILRLIESKLQEKITILFKTPNLRKVCNTFSISNLERPSVVKNADGLFLPFSLKISS